VGNYDRKVLDFERKRNRWKREKAPAKYVAFQWNDAHLAEKGRRFVRSLPEQRRRTAGGLDVLMVHGSPVSIDEPLNFDTSEHRFSELAKAAEADVVVCGHSHDPFVRRVNEVWFINPGSVGRPEGGDWRASYAVLQLSSGDVKVKHLRIPYDIKRVARAVHAAGLPSEYIDVFRKGKSLDQLWDESARNSARTAGRPGKKLDAVLALARKCRYEREHTHQVTRLALETFDGLKEVHQMGARERLWLQYASLLHDIGWMEGTQGHHKVAMRVIMSDAALPFGRVERQIVALVARYHRKALPSPRHKHYRNLGEADQNRVRVLAGILRVADGLDRGHENVVRSVRCKLSDRRIVVVCDTRGPAEMELAGAARKADLLEEVFGRPLVLKVASRKESNEPGADAEGMPRIVTK
jgi:putative phosphoesterase